ncbi:MAG: sugar transferase [Cyclobacteriaceae bacterium]|nr:sugar transferase [Cyclobacteriaceae bacterium]
MYWKTYLDKLVAALLIIALLPMFALVFLVLYISEGRPVLFSQMRSGQGMVPFKMYKFRSLPVGNEGGLDMADRQPNAVGRAIRALGIDELPQLVHIITGHMSFVGPRPLPVAYAPLYGAPHLARFAVKPGITGWAQVNGRNNMSWGKRFELDSWYVDHISVLLDLKILVMTIRLLVANVFEHKPAQDMRVFDGFNLD